MTETFPKQNRPCFTNCFSHNTASQNPGNLSNVIPLVSFRPSEASGEIRIPWFRITDPSTPLRSGRDDILNLMTLGSLPGFSCLCLRFYGLKRFLQHRNLLAA